MQRKAFSTLIVLTAWVLAGAVFFPQAARLAEERRELAEEREERFEAEEELEAFEGPQEYWKQEEMMFRDPRTGQIADDVRRTELRFAERLQRLELLRNKNGASLQSLTWQARGPFNVGGRVRAFAIDIDNESTLLVGAASGGMFRSENGGTSWTRVSNLSDISSVTTLAQDTRAGKRGTWYYGTGELRGGNISGSVSSLFGDGIFKSNDGGRTWQQLASTARPNASSRFASDFTYFHRIVTDPTKTEDVVYAATYGGIYRSADGGTTWTAVLGGNTANAQNIARFTDIAITSAGVLYAAINRTGNDNNTVFGVYRSTDGTNWTNISMQDLPERMERMSLGIAPSNENLVYMIAETPNTGFETTGSSGSSEFHSLWRYTYVSGDGTGAGGRWQNLTANMPAIQPEGGRTGNYSSQNSYDIFVRVKPDDANVVFIGGTEVYRSTSGFTNSTTTQKVAGYEITGRTFGLFPNQHPDQHDFIFLRSNPNVVFTANDGGVRRTDNIMAENESIEWRSLNNGFYSTQFYTVAVDNARAGDNTLLGGLQDQGSWRTTSSQVSEAWDRVAGADGAFCAIADSGAATYISYQNGTTFRVFGNRLIQLNPAQGTGYLFINPFILDPNNNNVMYMAGGRDLWRHDDLSVVATGFQRGERYDRQLGWTRFQNVIERGQISALAASRGTNTRLYFGTTNGRLFRLDNAQTGNNDPREITSMDFPQNGYITGIAVNPANPDQVLAIFSNYGVSPMYYSTDGGGTWTPVVGNLRANADGTGAGPSCRHAAFLNFGGTTRIYLATSTGLYSTTNLNGAMTQWTQEGASVIGNVPVGMVIARQVDGLVVAATYANGMYSANAPAVGRFAVTQSQSASQSSLQTKSLQLASQLGLEQNYPNPFSASTTIRYTLPQAGTVRLRVVSITGREVATLVNGYQTAGEHRMEWQGQGYGGTKAETGTYIYELSITAENGAVARRSGTMILSR